MPKIRSATTTQLIDLCETAGRLKFNRQLETEWIERDADPDGRHLVGVLFAHQASVPLTEADRIALGRVEWPPHVRCIIRIEEVKEGVPGVSLGYLDVPIAAFDELEPVDLGGEEGQTCQS